MKRFSLALAMASLAGCSLVNSFDEVVEEVEGSGGAGSGGADGSGGDGTGSGGADGSGGDGTGSGGADGSGGYEADSGAGGGVQAGGAPAAGGAGGAAGGADGGVFDPDQPGGVLVAYRSGPKDLVVADVRAGRILSSEPIGTVNSIVNDGATNTWYIFEQGATPADPRVVHARKLDPKTGAWRTLGSLTTGVPLPRSAIGVLTRRLVYVSDAPGGGSTLTLIDTQDPSAMRQFNPAARPTLPNAPAFALLATPQSAAVTGGFVNLLAQTAACGPAGDAGAVQACDYAAFHYTITNTDVSPAPSGPKVIGRLVSGAPAGVTADPSNPRADVVAFPLLADSASLPGSCEPNEANRPLKGRVIKYKPSDFEPSTTPVEFGINTDRFSGAAFDGCSNVLFLGSAARDPGIHVVPLDPGGTAYHQCVEGAGGFLFEPYERLLLRKGTNGDVDAFRLQGTRLSPTLQAASAAIPPNLVVTVMAVRAAVACN